jgi:hypothetical protein
MEIHHKGFAAKILFSFETDSFYGEVSHTSHLIVFQATHLNDAILAMKDAVDWCLEYGFCESIKEEERVK